MNLSANAAHRLGDVVKWYERYGRKLAALCTPTAAGTTTKHLVRNAIVTQTITARSGRVKGQGRVSILCDDGTGTGTDRVVQTNVLVWNPWATPIQPGTTTDRQVQIDVVDGLLQVRGSDCP